MQDFMQSLQMRWPVAATKGLSTQITASAPMAWPSPYLVELGIFSSSGQPAWVTPKDVFLECRGGGIAGRRRFFFAAAFSCKPVSRNPCPAHGTDAVIGLIEGTG